MFQISPDIAGLPSAVAWSHPTAEGVPSSIDWHYFNYGIQHPGGGMKTLTARTETLKL